MLPSPKRNYTPTWFTKKTERKSVGWPRIVETPVTPQGCVYCRLCTAEGTLQEVVCAKRDRAVYDVARKLKYGDELPVRLEPWVEKEKTVRPKTRKSEVKSDGNVVGEAD